MNCLLQFCSQRDFLILLRTDVALIRCGNNQNLESSLTQVYRKVIFMKTCFVLKILENSAHVIDRSRGHETGIEGSLLETNL